MWWIWFPFVAALVVLVFVSNKLGEYVDAMDKKTKLSGAFLGGILLAAVTSLPELITSITAVLMGQPEMTLGNILGSDVFDVAIIGFLMLIFCRKLVHKEVSRGNVITCIATFVCAVAILLCTACGWSIVIPGININILTPLILIIYLVTLFYNYKKGSGEDEGEVVVSAKTDAKSSATGGTASETAAVSHTSKNQADALSLRGIIYRFIFLAIILVGVSVAMTFMADMLAEMYNLQRGLAGALFLGVATSLPEIVSTFALVRLGNFDAGYGNIMGSCLFNFGVIAIADIFYFSGTVFVNSPTSVILAACLTAAVAVLLAFTYLFNSNHKINSSKSLQIVSGLLICASYVTFLALSV